MRHLARAGEIRQVAQKGKRIRTAHCDVRVNASLLHSGRVGIVVPKHGHRIVDRNRLRRRISELVRTELLAHIGTSDVLIRALPEAYDASFDALRTDVRTLKARFAGRTETV